MYRFATSSATATTIAMLVGSIMLSTVTRTATAFVSRHAGRPATWRRPVASAASAGSRVCRSFLSASSASTSSGAASSGGRVSSAVRDKELLDKTVDDGGGDKNKRQTKKKKKQKRQEKLDTNPPKGTRDFFPEDMRQRTWLFDKWRDTAATFGFVEYDAPVLESESLYTRKAGEEVTEQLYNFVDKGDRPVALRPEMTPSLARMVMSKAGGRGLPMPLKWYSIPQCWRYERMTRGRRREHFQWNMDIWGVDGVRAEAELLAAMVHFFESVGISSGDVGIKVNSRLVIGEVLTGLGIPPEKFAATCVLVDKLEKVPIDSVQSDLEELGLDKSTVEQLLGVLTNDSLGGLRDALGDDSEAVKQLEEFLRLCDAYGISDWIKIDASVVRGLAYYTGVVFEAFDRSGVLRAVAGGGRYDKLLETFGGDPTPAVGFGFGDAVIIELLRERGVLPDFDDAGIEAVVFAMGEDLYDAAISVASKLRAAGRSVDVVLEGGKKLKWVFKHADRIGAKYCVVVGESEYENGEVAVKNLSTGKQEAVKIDSLSEWAN